MPRPGRSSTARSRSGLGRQPCSSRSALPLKMSPPPGSSTRRRGSKSANSSPGGFNPMRGVVFLGERKLELQEFPDPAPGPGEVVLTIKASGMCGSDLHPYRAVGNAAAALALGGTGGPVVAGHEPCGVVAARGAGVSEADAPTGQRVMVHHYKGCGRCKHCKVGWAQLCRQGIVVYGMTGHGGHAAYMTVPAYTLVPLPDSLSFEEGAAISCGTGTAYGALKRLDVSGRDMLTVFGQGPVGLSATLLGVAMGARVIAVDTVSERRALAKTLGADA